MAASRGLTLPDRSIPIWLSDAVGAVCEWVWRAFSLKGAPPVTKQISMLMSRDCTLRDDKARAQLGYVPVVSVDDGLRELSEP